MKEKVKEVLQENFPDINFESSSKLVDDGILDSVTLLGVISTLSDEFDLTLPYEEVVPENFNSLEAMAELIEKYQ